MKTKNLLWLFLSLILLTIPLVSVSAVDDEVEIELFEVAGLLPGGDGPLGNPEQEGTNPPQPGNFHATITGNNLAITVANTSVVQLTVRNASGNVVLNRQFVGNTIELLTSGAYSLELQSGSLTLVGVFDAQ